MVASVRFERMAKHKDQRCTTTQLQGRKEVGTLTDTVPILPHLGTATFTAHTCSTNAPVRTSPAFLQLHTAPQSEKSRLARFGQLTNPYPSHPGILPNSDRFMILATILRDHHLQHRSTPLTIVIGSAQ